jgi:hypothetical protein
VALVFHRGLTVPLWAVAFGAVALTAPPRFMPSFTALIGIAVVASTMMAMIRWWRASRPMLVAVVPAARSNMAQHCGIVMTAGTRARTLEQAIHPRMQEPNDAIDLVRMDDDGGWQRRGSL